MVAIQRLLQLRLQRLCVCHLAEAGSGAPSAGSRQRSSQAGLLTLLLCLTCLLRWKSSLLNSPKRNACVQTKAQ